MRRLLIMLGLSTIAVVATPSQADAQMCSFCDAEGAHHWFDGEECTGGGGCKICDYNPTGPAGAPSHDGCHTSWGALACYSHVYVCTDSEAPDEIELVAMAEQRDVDSAVAFIQAGGLIYNAERSALQVEGCQGQIVMHVPIPDDFGSAITQALVER